MIVRYIIVDPDDHNELLVFQVPEHSRNEEFFVWLLEQTDMEFAKLGGKMKEVKPSQQK